jgi:hypothetical protein
MNARRSLTTILVACCSLLVSGCGPSVKLVPVSGKVSLNDQPLPVGAISFAPDAERNNTARINPTGGIAADGTYRVSTDGKPGAPVGWYKVTIRTQVPSMPDAKQVRIHPDFSNPSKTPLSVEVVENAPAGAYDLKVTK